MATPIASRDALDEIDPSLLLGHLLFLNLDEVKIHKDDLSQLFTKHNLSQTFLPNEIKPHDAYRRASSKAARTIEVPNGNGGVQKARLLVRETKKDDKQVVRNLVRELLDEKNAAAEYATVGKLIFDRDKDTMNVTWDANYLNEYDYRKILEDTQDLYVEWTQYHTKDTVRNIMNKVIRSMYPVSIMQGGRAQFIPKRSQEVLYNMKAVIEDLPGGSLAEIIHVIDTTDQRDLITKNLEKEVLYDVDKLLQDFSEVLQSPTIRSSTLKRYAQAVVSLQDKTSEYEKLLSSKMGMLQQQLQQAFNKVSSVKATDTSNGINEAI